MATAIAAPGIPLDQIDPSQLVAPTEASAGVALEDVNPADLAVPQDAGIPLDQIDPAQLVTREQYFEKLTPGQLAKRVAQMVVDGRPPQETAPLYDAAIKRYRESPFALLAEDRRTPEEKAADGEAPPPDQELPMGLEKVLSYSPLGWPVQAGRGLARIGGSMFEGTFKLMNEAGKVLTTNDWFSARWKSDAEKAASPGGPPVVAFKTSEPEQALENMTAAGKASLARGAAMFVDGARDITNWVFQRELMEQGAAKLAGRDVDEDARRRYQERFEEQVTLEVAAKRAEAGVPVMARPADPKHAPDAETVALLQQSPLIDPTNFIPFGVAFNATRKPLVAGATLTAKEAPGVLPASLAKATSTAARVLHATENAIDTSPIAQGMMAAATTAAVGGDAPQAALAALLGANVKNLGLAHRTIGKVGDALDNTTGKLLGQIPPGPIGRFAASTYRTLSPEAKTFAMGQLYNMPFLLGADTEEEFQDMLMAGALVHAAGSAGGRALNGMNIAKNFFAPGDRAPEIRLPVKDVGVDPFLDAAHQELASTLNNASNNFVESVRQAVSKGGGEAYVVSLDAYHKYLDGLVGKEVIGRDGTPRVWTADDAALAKNQQGMSFQTLAEDGSVRKVQLTPVRDVQPGLSVGHEATHFLERALLSDEERAYLHRETLRYYGEAEAHKYYIRHRNMQEIGLPAELRRDRSLDPTSWADMTPEQREYTLSEVIAEHGNGAFNALPIGVLGFDTGAQSYARAVYGMLGRLLERMGIRRPELSPEGFDPTSKPTTGLGIEPSIRLSTLIENLIQAKMLDGELPASVGAKPAPVGAKPAPGVEVAPRSTVSGAKDAPTNVRPVEPKTTKPGFKKGDPIGDLRNENGRLIGRDAVVQKDLGDGTYDVEYNDATTGGRVVGTIPGKWLESEINPNAPRPEKQVFPTSPITSESPVGAAVAPTLPVPKAVENTTRPEGPGKTQATGNLLFESPEHRQAYVDFQTAQAAYEASAPFSEERKRAREARNDAEERLAKFKPVSPAESPLKETRVRSSNDATALGSVEDVTGAKWLEKTEAGGWIELPDERRMWVRTSDLHAEQIAQLDKNSGLSSGSAKTSANPNVRTTPEKQQALAGPADPQVVQKNKTLLQEIEKQPRSARGPVETDYYSAESPVSSPNQVVREKQRLAADAAEQDGQPNPLRTRYQKIFVPYKVVENKNGTTSVFGMSLDKVAQNLDLLRGWLKTNPEAALVVDQAYLSGPEIAADLKKYLANQANGYAGDGRKLTRPADARDITPETPGYIPDMLPPDRAQVLNLLMGMEQPKTESRGQIFAREFAELNGIEVVKIGGVSETNSLRARLRDKGFDPDILNAVVENLRVDRLTTPLRPRPDLTFPAGDTGIQRAGFMPQTARRPQGNDETRSVVRRYIERAGIEAEPHERLASIDEPRMKRIADWFEQAKHEPENPEVQKAYRALADETKAQYQEMLDAGIAIEPFDGKGEPYASSADMMRDVRENKHLFFLSTDKAFGEGADAGANPLLEPSGIRAGGRELLMNDLFRAVHDYFGHTADGFEFGPRGEYNAYLAHSRMFSDAAKPALAAETLAQNSWVNFGPHLRRADGSLPRPGEEGYVAPKDRRFADQKTTIVPPELLREADAGADFMPQFKLGKTKVEYGDEYTPVLKGTKVVGRIEPDFANEGFRAMTVERDDIGTAPSPKEALKLFTVDNIKPAKKELAPVEKPKKGTAPAPTGWLLPDGEYAGQNDRTGVYQNTGDWHGEHILQNADDYASRFGLKRGRSEDLRLAALRSGFVRLRYDGASGRMGIEANAKHFKKQLPKLEDILEQNLGKIDRLDVNLFDDEGNVVRANGEAVFRLEDFAKSQAVLDILRGRPIREAGADFMPQAPKTDTPEFKKWFGKSKVVDEQGKPLVVFHGSHSKFNKFKPGRAGAMYFTPNRKMAEAGYGPNIVAAYLKIDKLADFTDPNSEAYKLAVKTFNERGGWSKNEDAMDGRESSNFDPATDHTWEIFDDPETNIWTAFEAKGYDGVKLEEFDGDVSYAVFKPTQIKSATGNRGTFDPTNPDIRYMPQSGPDEADARLTADQILRRNGARVKIAERGFKLDAQTGEVGTFWRNGVPPKGGRSYNFKDRFYESGVSVYPRPRATTFAGMTDREWYRITGEVVGYGSDGEPLVSVIKATKLGPKQLAEDRALIDDLYPASKLYVGDLVEQVMPNGVAREVLIDEIRDGIAQGRSPYQVASARSDVRREYVFADDGPVRVVGSVHDIDLSTLGVFRSRADEYLKPIREAYDRGLSTRAEGGADFMPAFGIEKPVRDEFQRIFERVKSTDNDGATFNPDGTVADTSALPVIVTVGALNQDAATATAKRAANFFNRHEEFLATPNARPGLFRFGDKLSADLNVALPLDRLDLAKKFAGDNNMDSIYNAASSEVVKTGGSGVPRLTTPQEYAVAARQLSDGTYTTIEKVQQIAAGLQGTEVKSIPNLDLRTKIKDAVAEAEAENDGKPLSKVRVNRITREIEADAESRMVDVPVISLFPEKGKKTVLNPDTPEKWDEVNRRADDALRVTALDPELGLGEFGYRRAFAESGLSTDVPPAPEQFARYVREPELFAKMIRDAQEKNPQLIESALGGLAHVRKMHELARAGKLEPETVALHMAWGIASRMLAPFDQEGGWIRVVRSPEVLEAMASSINGTFSLSKDEWKATVQKAMKESNARTDDPAAFTVGRNAIANLNAFHLMLSQWNGHWQELTGIFNNPSLTGPQMRDAFFRQGFGGAGIKHKVVSFDILTLARDDVFIGDRWQVIHGNLPLLERIAKERGYDSPFNYDKNGTPQDRVGIYGAYGPLIDSPSVGQVYYKLIERGMAAIGASPEVSAVFGRPLSASDVHWLSWNIIKNEPVGHSSLEVTYDLLTSGTTLNRVGSKALANELATRPIRTQRFNPETKGFDEFTVENNRAVLRRAANQ